MQESNNVRSHLRLDVTILLQYRKITPKEYKEIEQSNFNNAEGDSASQSFSLMPFMQDQEKEEENGNVDPFIANALIDINLKLNFILSMLSCGGETSIFSQKPIEANLSEGGIGFTTQDEFTKGQLLELKMMLPVFPIAIIKAWGKVVRINPSPEGCYKVGMEYINIKEEDQDKIVHYLFKRQRELLRKRNA